MQVWVTQVPTYQKTHVSFTREKSINFWLLIHWRREEIILRNPRSVCDQDGDWDPLSINVKAALN